MMWSNPKSNKNEEHPLIKLCRNDISDIMQFLRYHRKIVS